MWLQFKRLIFILFFGLPMVSGLSQVKQDIQGVVKDKSSGEALPFANVTLKGSYRGTSTNSDGYFVLVNEPVGLCTLQVQYIGYDTKFIPFKNRINANAQLEILLSSTVIEVEGVSVTANAELLEMSSQNVSQLTISPKQLSSLPSIGEVDVFRSIQLLPGISGASDGESGLYVRGGSPDQNLVLFDGMTIYHVDHFFGFFSAFNADAIKDVQVFKGGFPSEYGGRISSVINLTGKTGNSNKRQLTFGGNLLSAHGSFELPLYDWGNFLIAFRRSYTDLIQSPLYNDIYNLMTGDEESAPVVMGPGVQMGRRMGNMQTGEFKPSFYFYDFNSKLTLNPSRKDIVSFSIYRGKDDLDKSQDMMQMGLRFNDTGEQASLSTTDFNRWGNIGLSSKWSHQWGSRLNTSLLVAHSEYFSEYDRDTNLNNTFSSASDSTGPRRGFANSSFEDNSVKDLSLRFNASLNLLQGHTFQTGIWLNQFESTYQQSINDTVQILDLENKASLNAFYVQDSWRLKNMNINFGLRGSQFSETDNLYWEPRASITIPLITGINLKGAWGQYYQFVNRIVNENVLQGSRDFWILSTGELKPAFSEHRILGLTWENNQYLLGVEGYDKSMDNLVEYSRRYTGRASYSDYFFIGDGIARGVEFLAQKKRGALTGWLGYTLGKVEHTFEAFNDGNAFSADYDRRHEINLVSKYAWGVWNFAATYVFATGKAYTAPESQYFIPMLDGEIYSYIHVSDKNANRLPDYHRLDLSISRLFESDYWRTELGLSVFNATNHKNVWYREYNLDTTPVTITDALLLGFTPTFYVQFSLK